MQALIFATNIKWELNNDSWTFFRVTGTRPSQVCNSHLCNQYNFVKLRYWCFYCRKVPSFLTFVCQRKRTRLFCFLCWGGRNRSPRLLCSLHSNPHSCRAGSFNGFTIDQASSRFHISDFIVSFEFLQYHHYFILAPFDLTAPRFRCNAISRTIPKV